MGPGEKAGVRLPVLALGVSVGTGWESPALQRGLTVTLTGTSGQQLSMRGPGLTVSQWPGDLEPPKPRRRPKPSLAAGRPHTQGGP